MLPDTGAGLDLHVCVFQRHIAFTKRGDGHFPEMVTMSTEASLAHKVRAQVTVCMRVRYVQYNFEIWATGPSKMVTMALEQLI